MLTNYPQFIAWQFVQGPNDPKPRKVPIDPFTRQAIDPHNPLNWRQHDDPALQNNHTGFVFSERDPFFFVDIDNCRVGDGWNTEAQQICAAFPGFATEVSISGTGLHIVGVCDKSKLQNKKHKFKVGADQTIEFYINKRFMAFGQRGFQGSFHLDGTERLAQWVPQGNPGDDVELTDGPVLGYTGPADDDELIRRMLSAGGSIAQVMGGKARIADLWNADASILCQMFPATGEAREAYDPSSAAQSLLTHLAFWTGKDPARMDRLFRRSGLMRPKWDEKRGATTWGGMSIRNAIGAQQRIYDHVVQVAPATPESLAPDHTPDAELLVISEMQRHFAGCVYVRDPHAIMIPDGSLLKPDQFAATLGGHIFQLSTDMRAGGTTKNAFEAFTQCRVHKFPQVKGVRFDPKAQPGAIMGDSVNTYFPATVDTEQGDIKPFMDHVARMLPDERDRAILLTYMVSLVQNPGVKFQWAPVLQGTEGNGTSWLAKFISYAVGEKFCHKPKPEDITNKFNAWMMGKLFIEVQEIMMDGRYEMIENIKDWITDSRIEGHAKGMNQFMIDNVANWFLATNHKNALPVTQNSRRFAMLFTAQQTKADLVREGWFDTDYFPKLWAWTNNGGLRYVAHWLRSTAIPDERFNPAGAGAARAPMTSSTHEAISASLGNAEQYISEAIAAGDRGFRGGWVSAYCAVKLLEAKRVNVVPQRLNKIMEALGYRKPFERSSIIIMEESGDTRPVLYIRADMEQPNLTVEDYKRAQGYTSAAAPVALRVVG